MAKRALEQVEEFVEVADVSHPCENAKIHGVVKSLSPMKKSKNCAYFDCEISDRRALCHDEHVGQCGYCLDRYDIRGGLVYPEHCMADDRESLECPGVGLVHDLCSHVGHHASCTQT